MRASLRHHEQPQRMEKEELAIGEFDPIGWTEGYIQSELVNPIFAARHSTTLTNSKLTGWNASLLRSSE